MAYDKIIPVKSRLDHCVGYVLNHEKTDLSAVLDYIGSADKNMMGETMLETALNCRLETAYQDMMDTKRRWGKTGGVLGYHLIHSYAPGEVTPMQAHALGVEFARELLGERYEAVISTHLDRDHLHCHILFNSVSLLDGKKYRDNFAAYYGDIRGTSNTVSTKHGLSVIQPEGKGEHYAEWQAQTKGKATVRGLIRQDIDAAIVRAFTHQSFWARLEQLGYTVKRGPQVKYAAVRPPGGTRFIRLSSLGDGYTEEDIKHRLAERRNGMTAPEPPRPQLPPRRYTIRRGTIHRQSRKKLTGFRALYVHYLYLLGIRKPPHKRQSIPFAVRKEVTRLNRYASQFRFLQANRIDTQGQLAMLADALQAEIDARTELRRGLYREKRSGADVGTEIDTINQELRVLRGKLKTCTQIEQTIPYIQEQEQLYRDTQRKEQDHQHQKTDKAKPHKFSLYDR